MDFEAAADRLYGVDPDQFVALRAALVATARGAGERGLAAALGACRKPTRSAWLVNLLSRSGDEPAARLQSLADRLSRAHRDASLGSLRELGAERQLLVSALAAEALAAGAEHGYLASDAVRQEVLDTLTAALADADILRQVRSGRVVKAQVYSGFALLPSAADLDTKAADTGPATAVAPGTPATAPGGPAKTSVPPVPTADAEAARKDAQLAVGRATEVLIEARAALGRAQQDARAAIAALDRAGKEVAELRAELRAAELAEAAARGSVTEATDEEDRARTALQTAERALAEAAGVLGGLDDQLS